MTVLSAIQRASSRMGIARPDQVFGGTSPTQLRLQDTVNDVAAMIAFDSGRDWTMLKTLGTFAGDGATLGFPFPDDYKRMLKKAKLWPSASPNSPFTYYPDSDTWLGTQVQSFQPVVGAWTILGGLVQIRVGGPLRPWAWGTRRSSTTSPRTS
ncbi:hypothetical protein N8A98_22330 [Devosia neptuniae]|uniref:Uncharacterized protein n=1 Tax=Devosia neptuniae TaxID=191302 RepID=A0ABY6CFZ6_9HYPH|nr:hypothetical protein [Devosia neptuniae]UXN69911.1 hypothetical protein N8A98_22330 [Devosia neptuniae]